MLVKLNVKLMSARGKQLTGPEDENLFLKDVCEAALLSNHDTQKINGDEKNRRYKLWLKIAKCENELDLTAKEITKIKDLIGEVYGPIVVGQAWELLEKEVKLQVVEEAKEKK